MIGRIALEFSRSSNSTLRGYGRVALGIQREWERQRSRWIFKRGWHHVIGPADVDMTGLKKLARTTLPSNSHLRAMIESENESVPYSEFLVLVERWRKQLVKETENLPSRQPS
jgi:hypothetical protein